MDLAKTALPLCVRASAVRGVLQNLSCVGLAVQLLVPPSLGAQESPGVNTPPPGGSQQEFGPVNTFFPSPGNQRRVTATVTYSYVAPGDANFQGLKQSGSDAQSIHLAAAGAVPLNEHWFVPLGLSVANTWLESVPQMPIPDRINNLRLLAGLGYRINDQWTLTASLGPVLYRLDGVDGDDVGIAGMVAARYRLRPGLILTFGIGFNPDSDIPVLPAAGVRWEIQTNLFLNLMFPRPVLIYRLSPRLSFFGGGDFKFAVFRADENQGDKIGQPIFNDALGTYHDFHLGLGFEYLLLDRLSLAAEGGYAVGREIDYKHINQTVSFDPSPYCQVGVRYRF